MKVVIILIISSMIKQTRSTNQFDSKHFSTLFPTNQPNIHRLYQQSASSIIHQRNFLSLAPHTVFLAIEILRTFLLAESNLSSFSTKPLYLACISLASKLNEITPPTMEELEELQDFFIEVSQIVSMEERILKLCDFCLPITENILTHLQDYISISEQKCGEQYEKILYETLPDPVFLRYSPGEIAKAVIVLKDPERSGGQIKKSTEQILERLKHLMKGKAPSLKDLNIES